MSKKLYLLAPYDEIQYQAQNLVLYDNNDDIEVIPGLLYKGLKLATQIEKHGKPEAFIARGGTAWLLQQSNRIKTPIVEIPVNVYNIISALLEAREIGNKIGILVYPNMFQGIKMLSPVLNIETEIFSIKSRKDGERAAKAALTNGIQVLVGGMQCSIIAKELGVPNVLIRTDIEEIQKAIDEARRIIDVKKKEEITTKQLKAMLTYANEGIIATNQYGKVIICNPAASKIVNLPEKQILNEHIEDIIQNDILTQVLKNRETKIGEFQKINDLNVYINFVPIVINNEILGSVITFQDVTKIQEYEQRTRSYLNTKKHEAKFTFSDIIGNSKILTETKKKAKKFAETNSNILLLGETGTGKELFAQAIHNHSFRENGPFVALNCSALSESLLEGELFGYTYGAFTGAKRGGKQGLFITADKGTMFLDEISEISLSMQTKLLRVLQEKEIRPIGGDKVVPVDVRIIAASNRNLKQAVAKGDFRQDLYFRLNVLPVKIPPLRERKGDICLLLNHFLRQHYSDKSFIIDSEALSYLTGYKWPGNIRELKNFAERLSFIIHTTTKEITLDVIHEALDIDIIKDMSNQEDVKKITPYMSYMFNLGEKTLKEIENEIILQVLKHENYNQTQAAIKLGISRTKAWQILNNSRGLNG